MARKPKPVLFRQRRDLLCVQQLPHTLTQLKGDIDTLNVDVATFSEATEAGFRLEHWCGAGVAIANPDGTVKLRYRWGGAGVTPDLGM